MKPGLYRYQHHALLFVFCLTGIFLPGILERSVGTAAYPALLIAILPGILILLLQSAAFREEGGIFASARSSLGESAAKAVSVLYIFYFQMIAAELFCFYGLYIANNTAPYYYLAPIAAAVILCAEKSTVSLGRAAVIFAPILLVLVLIPVGVGIVKGSFENFLPYAVLSRGDLLRIALPVCILEMGQVIAVTVISPAALRSPRNTLPTVLIAAGIVLLIAMTSVLLDGQTPLINRLSRYAAAAEGDRAELKIAAEFVLFFCTVFRLSICLRAAAAETAALFQEAETRFFIPAYGVLLLGAAVCFSGNIGVMAEYLLKAVPYVSVLPLAVFPLILALCRAGRRKE